MAPIRKGDGTPLEMPGVSEVRSGDGRVFFEGGAIPDSVIDNFEDADADPPGNYEEGETLADYYSGATNTHSRTTSDVIEGDKAFNIDSDEIYEALWSRPGDGLNRYPEPGDKLGALIRSNGGSFGLFFNVEDGSSPGGYSAYIFSDPNDMALVRKDDLSDFTSDTETTLDSTSVSLTDGDWYWFEVQPQWGGDIVFDLYEVDESTLERGNHIEGLTSTDLTYEDERGVGLYSRGSSAIGTSADWLRILD